MTDEQKAAYIMSQAAMLMAKVAGMQASNQIHMAVHGTPLYLAKDFEAEAQSSGCGHNDVLTCFQR